MRALAVTPGQAGTACLLDVPEPGPEMGGLLVQTLEIGTCGTDVEIVSGRCGWPPRDGSASLARINWSCVGRPRGLHFALGDLIV
jgi:glucose 1-dehydrogenase